MLRRALRAERFALLRLSHAPQHRTADTQRSLFSAILGDTEALLRIKASEFRTQSQTALRDLPHAPPLARGHLKDFAYDLLRRHVAFPAHGARILVLDYGATFFELLYDHVHTLQYVEGLEASDNDRDAIFLDDRRVLVVAHDGANMAGGEESLHAVIGRTKDGFD